MPFITLEGIEGSGKSTQARLLGERLGPNVVLTMEPGGTSIGRALRDVLLDPRRQALAPSTELLLYFADRAQHVAEVIRPALAAGRTVISDRYVESSLAYQGYGRGLPLAAIRGLAELATGGLRPDLIVFLEMPIEEGLARAGKRGGHDRLEAEVRAFHERVLEGYFNLMAEEPSRWVKVDGQGSAEAVAARLWSVLEGRGILAGRGHGVR